MLQDGVIIRYWDEEGGDGTIELDLDNSPKEERILHICLPRLDGSKTLSVYLADFERALRRLRID